MVYRRKGDRVGVRYAAAHDDSHLVAPPVGGLSSRCLNAQSAVGRYWAFVVHGHHM